MVVGAENDAALAESTQKSETSKLFDEFVQAQTCNQIFTTFHNLCQAIDIVYPPLHSSTDHCLFYPRLKQRLSDSWKAESLWKKLDKRFYGKEYFVNSKSSLSDGKRIGESHKVLIIGAGPCGLRTAIEMACLGVKAVVVEKRDNFSRNNILHLWPFIITDLKTLGAKIFHGKFCAGAIDHISIRQLQLILLKVTLLLGVEVIVNVSFEHLSCPVDDVICEDGTTWHKGWSATVSPSNHHISNFEFDVIVGADGKRNTLQGFKRKEFRGKLAIGLTANFINRHTTAEAKVQEISGVAYIFNQQFFKDLLDKTNIDLENIVYYKGETHYFVMTAKKHSLITKGVLKQDYDDTEKLLCYANVDQEALSVYAREAADFSTNYKLPNLEFAINQFGQPDIALFDFTCMYAAENAAMFQEVKGRKLLSCLVGDSLLEPFWPMGTGCARGFLAAFDLVWMVRRLCLKREAINNNNIVMTDSNMIELEALAERESIYRLLHHSTPQNTAKNWAKYTIDPSTRYTNLNMTKVSVKQVRRLYLSDRDIGFNRDDDEDEEALIQKRQREIEMQVEEEKKHSHLNPALTRKVSLVRSNKLLTWCRRITSHYDDIVIRDMTSSWKSGLALSAIIHQFRPDLISWEDLDPAKVEENNQLAFDVAEKYFGISPVMTGKEMASCQEVDKLIMVTYISQFYEVFKNETPAHDHKRGEQAVKNDSLEVPKSPLSSTSPVGLLIRFTNHIKRKSEKSKHDDPAKKKKLGGFFKKKENSSLATEVIHENKENEGIESAEVGTLKVGGTVVQLRNKDPELTASVQNNINVNSQRTSNRISALSSQLMSQFEQNAPLAKPYLDRVMSKQVSLPDESMSDKCYFCVRRIYIVERMSAEGLFFHRQCFVCSHCGVTLRRGNYEFLSDTGKFFCKAHYMAHSGAFKTADQKRAETTDSIKNKASNTLTTLKNQGAMKLRQPTLTTGSRRTPERIELENIRMSIINQPQRQLSEEAVNQHNLSTGVSAVIQERIDEAEAEDDYDIDDFMSESSDDDIDWEAMLREANQLGDNNFTNDSDFGSRDRSASESSSRGGRDVTVISWLHDGSYIEKPEPVTNCQEDSEVDDLNTMADLSGEDELDHSNFSTLRRPLTPVKEEMSQDPSPFCAEDDDFSTHSSSSNSSSNVSMADVDLGSDGEIPLKPVATPRVSIRASKPNTLPRSCRPGKFTLPESDAAFRQLFQGVALSNSKEPQPIDGFEPRECLFLSVAEMEVQRNQFAINSNPAKCPVSYLPKNELTMLSNDEESNQKDNSMHEAIHKWLSGCMGSEANHNRPDTATNGRHNCELGTTSESSDSDNEKKTNSMSSSSSVSHVDNNNDCLSLLEDAPQKQETEKPAKDTTMMVEEPHELHGGSSDNDSLDDYLLSSLSTASQSSLPDIALPGSEENQVASKTLDPNMLPTEGVVAESQPVKKPRTIFNLLSSPTQEGKVLIPDLESRSNKEEAAIPDEKSRTNEVEKIVVEDEDPVVEASNPFQKNPSQLKAGGSSVEPNNLEAGVTNVLRKEDTMDRVHQYLLQNPVGGNSTNEDDDLAFSDGLTGEEDVELSSESSSSSASEFNTATLDVTELLEDSPNQRTTVQATVAMTCWTAGAKTTDSILLRAATSGRNDNTSVWSNLPDETLDQANQPPDASYTESFISAYNPGRGVFADESTRKPRPPPERTSSFDSLELRMKSRLSQRNKWFRQTHPEAADSPPVGAAGDASGDRVMPAKPDFGSDVDDSPTEPSAPPQTPGVGIQIIEASPLDSHVTHSAQLGLLPASHYDSDSDQFFTPTAQTPLTRRPDHTTSPLASPPGTRHVLNQLDDLRIAGNVSTDARLVDTTSVPEASQLSGNRRLPPTPPTSANSTLNRRSLPALPKIAHLEALSPTGSPQSPQSSAHALSTVDEQLRARELRVQQRVEKLKAQTIRRKSDAGKSSSSIDEVDSRVRQTPPTTADDSNPPSTQSASCDISHSGDSPKPKRKNSFRQKLRRMQKKKDLQAPVEHKMRRALPVPNLAAKNLQDSTTTTSPIESTPKQKSAEKKKKRGKLRKSKGKVESTVTTGSGTESGGAKKQSHPKGTKSLFRLSPKKKEKLKRSSQVYEVDGMTTLERKYPVQSDRERAILRGERIRLLPDIPGEDVSVRRVKERSSTFDSAEDDPHWRKGSSSKKRSNTISGLTAAEIDAKITRRVQIAARRQAKMEAQKRLRRAQVIQRQLEEVEVKQRELEERGVTLEKLLREDGDDTERDDSQCMQEWFRLVQDKNALLRYENELMIYQRELQLEDVQSQLQQDLRERMALDDKRKTSAELAQEKEILRKMLDVVEQRDELVGLLEEQRLKEKDEAVDMETLMLSKFNAFSQEPRDDTSSDSVTSTPRNLAAT